MNIQLLLSANQGQAGLSPTLPPTPGSPRTAQIFHQVFQAASHQAAANHQADNIPTAPFNSFKEHSTSADSALAKEAIQNVTTQWQATKQTLISSKEGQHSEHTLSVTVLSSDPEAFSTTQASFAAQTNSLLINSSERKASMAIKEAASRIALIASYSADSVTQNEVNRNEQAPRNAEITSALNKEANTLPNSSPSREAEAFTASFFGSARPTTSDSLPNLALANASTLDRQIKNQVQEPGQPDNAKAPSFALGTAAVPLLPVINAQVIDATVTLQSSRIEGVDQPVVSTSSPGEHTRDTQPIADLMTTEYSAAKKDTRLALPASQTPIATTEASSTVAPPPSLVSTVTLQESANKPAPFTTSPTSAGLTGDASPLQQKATHAQLPTSPTVSTLPANSSESLTTTPPLATPLETDATQTFTSPLQGIGGVVQPVASTPSPGEHAHNHSAQAMADLMATEHSAKKDSGPALLASPAPIATDYPPYPNSITDATSAAAPLPSLASVVTLQQSADKPAPFTISPTLAGLTGDVSPLQQSTTHARLSTPPATPQADVLIRLPLDTMLKVDNSDGINARSLLEAEATKNNKNINKSSELPTSTLLPSSPPAMSNSSTTITLSTPVTSPAWPSQFGQQLVQFAQRGGEHQVKMQLHPAELGPLSISLKVSEQGAQAHFLTTSAQARQVIELAIPQLREALAEQGISLGETSVGEQSNPNEQAFAHQGSSASGSGNNSGSNDDDLIPLEQNKPLVLDGRVDLYA